MAASCYLNSIHKKFKIDFCFTEGLLFLVFCVLMKQGMMTVIENFTDGTPSYGLVHSYKSCRIESHFNKINNLSLAFSEFSG